MRLKVGDALTPTANCGAADMFAGDVGTVTAVDPAAHLATVRNDEGEESQDNYKEFRNFQREQRAAEQARTGHDAGAAERAQSGLPRNTKLHILTSECPPYQSTARAAIASEPDLSKTRPGVHELHAQRPAVVHSRA